MPKLTCPICGKPIEIDEDTIPFKDRTAHKICFNTFVKVTATEKKKQAEINKEKKAKTKKAKPVAEMKDGLSEEEFRDKQELFAKIRELQQVVELTAKTYKLVEDYIRDFNFTYKGITRSLDFFYGIQGNMTSNDIIGIVPYVYDEAQEFFSLGEKTLLINKNVNLEQIKEMYKVRTVRITPKVGDKKQIDIGSIGV